ncbi:MAG TPA: phosphate ABC transporter permease PstA [Acidimicrobiia bacterium]|nr:phosphate ABC transporter permease PstA [Acidimicrobiia bacterium]
MATTAAPSVTVRTPELARRRGADAPGAIFRVVLFGGLTFSLLLLAVLIWQMWSEGGSVITDRFGSFVTSGMATEPAEAGVWQGIKGTVLLGLIVAFVAFPLGICAAIYLEEYSRAGRFARVVDINIRNLAGVPSIVYGLLGLAVFVKALGDDGGGGLTGGRTLISAGLTLSLLVLPIVIITAQEALRAVPSGIREGALALGATRWEMIRYHVVPAAAPGMLTGTVLSLARAAGEAAPLLVVGATTGVFFTGNQGLLEQITDGRFTALPMVIFSFARQPASQGWPALVGAASLVLLALIFLMNAIAIYFRNRYEKKW